MRKRKVLSLILSLAVLLSFSPFFTIQADAFSTGSTKLLKTKTVTIKPGKTYKSPKFKLKKKMLVQVPIYITTKSSKTSVTKGGYKMYLKSSKNKTMAKFSDSLVGYGGEDGFDYSDWIYFYKKLSKPCFSKGKYYISIKNTTNTTIKVKFSVKGYTKFASKASLSKDLTIDYNSDTQNFVYLDEMLPYVYVGRIGPGLPAVKSIESSNSDVEVYGRYITHDGKIYISVDSNKDEADTVLSVYLLNNKTPYKINVKVYNSVYDEEY
jgi:hypothetical protein